MCRAATPTNRRGLLWGGNVTPNAKRFTVTLAFSQDVLGFAFFVILLLIAVQRAVGTGLCLYVSYHIPEGDLTNLNPHYLSGWPWALWGRLSHPPGIGTAI